MARSPNGPKTVTIDGEEFETAEVVAGRTYMIRELSVREQDDIEDASKNQDGTFNARLNMRLALHKGIVTPITTVDDIEKWPSKRYVLVSRAFNALNTVPEAREAGKAASPPETSGAST